MAPKMDKNLLAQLKSERVKQSPGGGAPKRKSSRLQKELNVESFLDADFSRDPSLDLVVELLEVDGGETSKRKAKGTAVEGTPASKKVKTVAGPSTLANFQEALESASGLLCAADKDSLAEMSLQSVGELMLVEMAMVGLSVFCQLAFTSVPLFNSVIFFAGYGSWSFPAFPNPWFGETNGCTF